MDGLLTDTYFGIAGWLWCVSVIAGVAQFVWDIKKAKPSASAGTFATQNQVDLPRFCIAERELVNSKITQSAPAKAWNATKDLA